MNKNTFCMLFLSFVLPLSLFAKTPENKLAENNKPGITETQGKKWWQKPIRVIRRDYGGHYEKFMQSDLSELARETREVWHCNTEWIKGTLGSAPGLADVTTFDAPGFKKLKALGKRDVLREYTPIAHENGVHVIVYLNMHWFSYEFAAKHPGWEQKLSTGKSYGRAHPLYGNGTTMCVNSPWRKWALKLIIETAKTGVDGIFLDGPVVYPGCCYCETCQKLFLEETGNKIPLVEDWSNPLWKKFIAFREESMVNFLRDAREALHSVNPDAMIYLNCGKWRNDVARSPEQLEPYQDITGAEAFFHPGPQAHNLYKTLVTAKFLSAGRNPAMVFTHHALGAWHYLPLPPTEMKLAIAQTVAGGANPWFAVFDVSIKENKKEAVAGVAEIQSFLEKNEAVFTGENSKARVALWASEQTSRYYISQESVLYRKGGSGREENLIADVTKAKKTVNWGLRKKASAGWIDGEIQGYFLALSRSHIPFDMLWDAHISADKLKNYDVLILPNVACLSKSQKHAIYAFVRSGGTLVADFESGRYDETGEKVNDARWLDFLGIREIHSAFVPSVVEDYFRIVADGAVTDGLKPGQLLARPQFALKVTAGTGTRAPAVFLKANGLSYQGLPADSQFPALLTRNFGKGRVVYFSSLEGEFYFSRKIARHRKLIADAVLSARQNRMNVSLKAPATVYLDVRSSENGNALHIHLVNSSGDMQRPMTEIIPVRNLKIYVKNVHKGMTAHSLWRQENLPVQMDGDIATVTLPELDVYDVVVIK